MKQFKEKVAVADVIVNGIRKNKARGMVGRGMGLLDFGKRMVPAWFDRLVTSQ